MIRYENNLRVDQNHRTRCNYCDFCVAQSYMELKSHKQQRKAREQVVHQEKYKLLSEIMKVHRPSIEDIFQVKTSWYEAEIRWSNVNSVCGEMGRTREYLVGRLNYI